MTKSIDPNWDSYDPSLQTVLAAAETGMIASRDILIQAAEAPDASLFEGMLELMEAEAISWLDRHLKTAASLGKDRHTGGQEVDPTGDDAELQSRGAAILNASHARNHWALLSDVGSDNAAILTQRIADWASRFEHEEGHSPF